MMLSSEAAAYSLVAEPAHLTPHLACFIISLPYRCRIKTLIAFAVTTVLNTPPRNPRHHSLPLLPYYPVSSCQGHYWCYAILLRGSIIYRNLTSSSNRETNGTRLHAHLAHTLKLWKESNIIYRTKSHSAHHNKRRIAKEIKYSRTTIDLIGHHTPCRVNPHSRQLIDIT